MYQRFITAGRKQCPKSAIILQELRSCLRVKPIYWVRLCHRMGFCWTKVYFEGHWYPLFQTSDDFAHGFKSHRLHPFVACTPRSTKGISGCWDRESNLESLASEVKTGVLHN